VSQEADADLMKIRIYTEDNHAPSSDWRNNLILILKAFWGDGTDWDRESIAYIRDYFAFADTIGGADIVALPMAWNYYVSRQKIRLALDLAERADRFGKRVMIWSEGDNSARIPFENIMLFQYSIQRSRRRRFEYARTPFTRDYAAIYLNNQIAYRPKPDKPLIGFCGQAASKRPWLIWLRNLARNLEARFKTVYFDPPPLGLMVNFRAKVLRRLQSSPLVSTRFIIRSSYGGRQTDQAAVDEYVRNLHDTDYTVCMRGGGNYSIRFPETLSMGRIPIFVDTDCVLPYDFKIDWKQYCVWVDEADIDRIGEIVAAFHERLSPSEFTDLQRECRRIWEEYLTQPQFFKHFYTHFEDARIPVSGS
jgi:hypothetical protein